jgi:uncharacterized protein YcbK (DUF882 family)
MIKVLKDLRLTENFMLSEFVCHDGNNEVMLAPELACRLQALRDILKRPVKVAAGYRSPAHNKAVGGSPNSRHMLGEAADIKVNGVTVKKIALEALRCGFKGIGVYRHNGDNFVHCDVRTGVPSYWKDNPGTKNLTKLASLNEL